MQVSTDCPQCDKMSLVRVSDEGFRAWRNGQLIQLAMPELSPSEREMLVTGICPECWEKMWGEDDDR